MRVGFGYDVHAFGEHRPLIIGGVLIPYKYGLLGHSDADVLIHAIMDSMLGALALGDIGYFFPDNNESYRNVDSTLLLEETYAIILNKGYSLGNLDTVIVAQEPKMAPFIPLMRERISEVLKCEVSRISIKATTTEYLGFVGRKEGISASSICLLEKIGG